jgi:secreted PhoX family phosphatase
MRKRMWLAVAAGAAVLAVGAAAVAAGDFGLRVQDLLLNQSKTQFGVSGPLTGSSTQQITQEQALQHPAQLATVAKGLSVRVVTSGSAPNVLDQIALWPDNANPQWLIECNEGGTADLGLVRIDIATGATETIVTGTTSCDPVRATPWGTILFGEEAGGGATGGSMYELTDPIGTTGVTLDRVAHTFSGGTGSENLSFLPALGHLSFEGLSLYDSGLLYYGDENRPSVGTAGGAYFKFVPDTLAAPGSRITSALDSPLASGSIYGLRLGLRNGATDYGQGTQYGFGTWVSVCSGEACDEIDLRAQAATLHLTGYYRPEDSDVDPVQEAAGYVRSCGPNTGNEEDDQLWGEVICITDGTIADAESNTATPEVQLLVEGNPGFAMPDNVAFQPGTNNLVVHEDADTGYLTPHNNDLWDCLPDGADENPLSDGCVRVATLNDLTAEWTGGIFSADGKHFYVSVQHNISGFGVVLEITGWK